MEARGKRAAFSEVRWARSVRPRRRQLPQGPSVCDKIAASSDCSRPVNDYVHIEAADLCRPNARFTQERQGYQVLTPFGKLGYSRKFDASSGHIHRLEHHSADVAACFEALLRDPVLRARFVQAAGADGFSDTTAARLTFLAYLHDFGKLNAGFQFKVRRQNELPRRGPQRAGHIAEALLCFDQSDICTLLGLHDIVNKWGAGVVPLLYAMLAHHGRPARRPTQSGGGPPELWRPFAGYDPRATARLLGELGRRWFPDAFGDGPPMPDEPALAHLFAGVVALADQLGSDENVFEYEPDPEPHYIERARRIATEVVRSKGFLRIDWPTDAAAADVRTLFDYVAPRPSQRAVSAAPLDRPLLILESETGSGKTEAAVLRFAGLWRAGLVDGLYFAVPTRAAAKQLHGRVRGGLDRLLPPAAHAQTVLAVPGYLVAGAAEGRRVEKFEVFWEDEPDEETRLARWSAESARKFLSAPAAVGTVDQVLLAGLRVKWAHFRAASLSRSLLVVDEVHASDAYMTELLFGVLRGHLALGGHALLMSATLGSAARSKFMSSSARSSLPAPHDAEDTPYPALTLAGDGASETCAITGGGPTKSVLMRLVPILGESVAIARSAVAAARDGAKVLVIRNTVNSAQDVFGAVLEQRGEDGGLLLEVAHGPALHHSRFAAEDRRLLDDAVEQAIGKGDRPPGGMIVIGTQTLEQSLDIDADLLISDLCPVDASSRSHTKDRDGDCASRSGTGSSAPPRSPQRRRGGFPAHAGMDPTQHPLRLPFRRLPRTRGDGPLGACVAPRPPAASPHTRGWTPRSRMIGHEDHGFPAHAGMDPVAAWRSLCVPRLPRTRGDGPAVTNSAPWSTVASPHTRGWTRSDDPRAVRALGFPAHAGMDRVAQPPRRSPRGLPRTRGDGP